MDLRVLSVRSQNRNNQKDCQNCSNVEGNLPPVSLNSFPKASEEIVSSPCSRDGSRQLEDQISETAKTTFLGKSTLHSAGQE